MFLLIFGFINFKIFYPIYTATEVIIPYGIHPFDICSKNPELWKIIKTTYIFTSSLSLFLIGHFIYSRIILNVFNKIKNLKSNIRKKFDNSKENQKSKSKNSQISLIL